MLVPLCGIASLAYGDELEPDKALYTKAQQAWTAGKWDDVITTVDNLCKQYPDSKLVPDGMVLQHIAYLSQGAFDKATVLEEKVAKTWPRTRDLWVIIANTSDYKGRKSPQDAVAYLDGILKQDLLAPGDRKYAMKQRLVLLGRTKSDQYVNEMLAAVKDLKDPLDQNEVVFLSGMAQGTYRLLMKAKRFDEAKALSQAVQDNLAKIGNPPESTVSEQIAYFDALKAADPKRFTDEIEPVVKLGMLVDNAAEANYYARILSTCYVQLLRLKPFKDVKSLHECLQAATLRFKQDAAMKSDQSAWLVALQFVKPEMLLQDFTDQLARLKAARTVEEAGFSVSSTEQIYHIYFEQKKAEDAKTVHGQVQEFLTRFKQTDDVLVDNIQYAVAHLSYQRKTAREEYNKTLATTLKELLNQAKTLSQVRPILKAVTIDEGYTDLFQIGKAEEAGKIYDTLQAAITRISASDSYDLMMNQMTYLSSLGNYMPDQFLKLYLARVDKAEKASTPEELQVLTSLVSLAYSALGRAERIDDLKHVHAQLQTAAGKMPNAPSATNGEFQQYLAALAKYSSKDFLGEVQPVLEKLAKAQTLEEARQYAPVVQAAYGVFNDSGQYAAARTAHDQLQALYTKLARTAEATADEAKYTASISQKTLDALLQEFKKALVHKDNAGAKKNLDQLRGLSPDSPQAKRAKELWDASGLK